LKEIFVTEESLPDAYHKSILALYNSGVETNCPDYNQKQIECSMTVHIEAPLSEPRISRLIIGTAYDLKRYELEILDGVLDSMIGHGWDYTYHSRYALYVPFIINELKRNPDSRRAVISVRDNEVDSNSDDPSCLQSIQYFIRDDMLHSKVLFRSNDLAEAFFFNAFALIRLQENIADELGVKVGSYTHRSNSMHVYEKDFGILKGYVNAIITRKPSDLTYYYFGDFKEQMEEEVPNIMRMVNSLKEKVNCK